MQTNLFIPDPLVIEAFGNFLGVFGVIVSVALVGYVISALRAERRPRGGGVRRVMADPDEK